MDRTVKFLLSLIALSLIMLNMQLAGVTLVREAHARINGEDLIPIAQILGNIQERRGE